MNIMNIFKQGRKLIQGYAFHLKSVGNSPLSLVAALIDLSSEEGVVSIPKEFFVAFTPPNLSLKVVGAKNLPVCFVKGTHL